MFSRLALFVFLGGALAAPALAFNPQPDPPGKFKAGTDLVLSNGSIAHVSPDGEHVTTLKDGKAVFVPEGTIELKDGTIVIVGPEGLIKGHKAVSQAVAPSHPH